MFDDGLSENLVFSGEARWRGSQWKRLAAALESNTPQLANFRQILAVAVNCEFSLRLKQGFVIFQKFQCTDIMIDIMKDASSMLTNSFVKKLLTLVHHYEHFSP